MPSAAQIRARKAFVKKYAKKGKRSKSNSSVDVTQKRRARARSKYPEVFENLKNQRKKWDIEEQTKLAKRYTAKGKATQRQRLRRMSQDQKTAEIEKDVRQHMKWHEAKQKYGYGTVDLLQFYFNVPYRMARQLGLPKTAPKYGQSPAL